MCGHSAAQRHVVLLGRVTYGALWTRARGQVSLRLARPLLLHTERSPCRLDDYRVLFEDKEVLQFINAFEQETEWHKSMSDPCSPVAKDQQQNVVT